MPAYYLLSNGCIFLWLHFSACLLPWDSALLQQCSLSLAMTTKFWWCRISVVQALSRWHLSNPLDMAYACCCAQFSSQLVSWRIEYQERTGWFDLDIVSGAYIAVPPPYGHACSKSPAFIYCARNNHHWMRSLESNASQPRKDLRPFLC